MGANEKISSDSDRHNKYDKRIHKILGKDGSERMVGEFRLQPSKYYKETSLPSTIIRR